MNNRIFIVIALILITSSGNNIVFAQNQKDIDSLSEMLTIKGLYDTTKVDIYNELGFLYRSTDKELALLYLDTAASIAKKINDKDGLTGTYNRYGIVYKNWNKLDEAIAYYEKSITLARELNDKERTADVYNNLGNVYRLQGSQIKAAESFIKALKLREETNDRQGVAAAYSNLAFLYTDQLNYTLAIENNQKAIQLFAAANDSFELARSNGYMGYIYYYQNIFDSAIAYNNIALHIFERLGDKYETSTLLSNLGNILAESGNPQKGLEYHKQALAIQIEIGDSVGIYSSNLSLAQTYLFLNKIQLAEKHIIIANDILTKIDGIINMYMTLNLISSQIYKAKGDYKKAYQYMMDYTKLSDSLVNESNSKSISELQTKYNTEKKDHLIEKNKLELANNKIALRQKNIISASLATFIVVTIIIFYLLYNRYKLRKKQELNEIIIRQQNIRSKAVIDAEEKERTRIAKDLHDGIGQQLSAIKLMASSLANTHSESERIEKVYTLKSTVDDAVKEVRSVSHNMMPNALFKLGLSTALREFIDKISSTGFLKISLEIIGLTKQLDNTTEIILYRVIQELVNNTIKHANATQLTIQIINHDDKTLNIIVEDNGTGFDANNKNKFEGIGLKNIISRIEYLNGTVEFDTLPGRGTTVIIDVPTGA